MPEVPFTRIGAGQSARLVYQVMGSNGPIGNPNGIRFMDPGTSGGEALSGGAPIPGLFSLSGAMALADLGLGVANVGLSAAVLQTVRRVERRLDDVWLAVEYESRRITEVAQRLERVDVNVAEQNLRSSMRHVLSRCVHTNGVDLNGLDVLVDDLDKFTDSVAPWGFGLAPNLRLSSDTRAMLGAIWHMVYGAQLSMIATHNMPLDGDPERLRRHPFDDLCLHMVARLPSAVVARLHILRVLRGASDELGALVCANFFFAGEGERESYKNWFENRVEGDILAVLSGSDPIANVLADYLDSVLPEIESDEHVEELIAWVSDYLAAWMMSDAGLLFRAEQALLLNRDQEFWSALSLTPGDAYSFELDVDQAVLAVTD
jgi:hypothetical protein